MSEASNTTGLALVPNTKGTASLAQRQEEWANLTHFVEITNAPPKAEGVKPTPDKKARTLVISYVETALDEMFLGQWSTKNFQWRVVQNELAGSIELEVVHPISGYVRTLIGAAATPIMVDAAPQGLDAKAKNQWANDPSNKKSKALHMDLPRLKAECLKNAALGLGRAFGRDLNRKEDERDEFKAAKAVTNSPKLWKQRIADAFAAYTGQDAEELRAEVRAKIAAGEFTPKYARSIVDMLEGKTKF